MAATWIEIGTRSAKSVQAATEAAPAAATEGVLLADVAAISIWIEADAGQTLTGSGVIDIYMYDEAVGAWAIAPLVPFSIPTDAAGVRRCVLGTIVIDNPRGRLAPICRGVGVSSGGATVYVTATLPGQYLSGMRAA